MALPTAIAKQVEEAEKLMAGQPRATEQSEAPLEPQTQDDQKPPAIDSPKGYIDPEDYKARYSRLRLARDEQKEALERELEAERKQLAELQRQLEEMRTANQEPEPMFTLTPEQEESWSQEQKEAYLQMAHQFDERLQSLKKDVQVQSAPARDPTEMMYDDLDSMLPDWREQNVDPNFKRWLDEVDPLTGDTRKTLLDYKVERNDSAGVANIFKAFKNASRDDVGNVEFEANRARPDFNASETEIPWITQAEIKAFYEDKQKKIASRKLVEGSELAKQYRAREMEIEAAIQSGRVR